jgi:hypothetical protein
MILSNRYTFNMAHSRSRERVAFLKRNPIKLAYVNEFEAHLQSTGYNLVPQPEIRGGSGTDVDRRDMRIYLEDTPTGKKFLQWRGFSKIGQKGRWYTEDLTWCAHENKITIILGTDGNTKFSDEERLDILKWIETFLKVSEIVIENRQIGGSTLLPSDTENNINAFLGFVYKEAIRRWTKEPEYSDLDQVEDQVEDRLFECWKCKQLCDCTEFQSKHSDERQMFFQLLSAYVLGELPCCTACVRELTIYHVPNRSESSRPAKKIKM